MGRWGEGDEEGRSMGQMRDRVGVRRAEERKAGEGRGVRVGDEERRAGEGQEGRVGDEERGEQRKDEAQRWGEEE